MEHGWLPHEEIINIVHHELVLPHGRWQGMSRCGGSQHITLQAISLSYNQLLKSSLFGSSFSLSLACGHFKLKMGKS
jgi:hypothetical protein